MAELGDKLTGTIIGAGAGLLITLVTGYINGSIQAQENNTLFNTDNVNIYSTINFIKYYGPIIILSSTLIGSLTDIYRNIKNFYKDGK
jgi:hypothetical protein